MPKHLQYVPILKWKMGEYQALSRLATSVKDNVVPLLEVPPVGFDFETQQQKKTNDDHLKEIGRRLYSKWQARRCFLDVKHIPCDERMADGQHYVDYIFQKTREEGCAAVPTVSLKTDPACLAAIARAEKEATLGICLRLYLDDFDRDGFEGMLDRLLGKIRVGWSDTDLVLDLASPNYVPRGAYVRLITSLVDMIPNLNRARSWTLAGTSYPSSIAALKPPFELLPRLEWTAYRAFVESLDSKTVVPSFGDYAVAHPDLVELDMRIIKPFAKLRYTLTDKWHVARGANVRANGFEQYREMCSTLIEQPYFSGRKFSEADAYIEDCAAGDAPTGNLSTWVWVATNRHITKVVYDLSKLFGPSGSRG